MRLSVSTIALPSFDHEPELRALAESGIAGVEVSPSKAWPNPGLVTPGEVATYRRMVERAGLTVVGIHSLLYDKPQLGWFKDQDTRAATMDHLVHLSNICVDLGGKSMVFGSGGARDKGPLAEIDADHWAVEFLSELAHRIQGHGTRLAIEPLAPEHTNYIHTLSHAARLVREVDRPEVRVHLDLAAAAAAQEINVESMQAVAPILAHVHVNEPDLVPLRKTGEVDHAFAGNTLKKLKYDGFCSLEQRLVSMENIMPPLKESIKILNYYYG